MRTKAGSCCKPEQAREELEAAQLRLHLVLPQVARQVALHHQEVEGVQVEQLHPHLALPLQATQQVVAQATQQVRALDTGSGHDPSK